MASLCAFLVRVVALHSRLSQGAQGHTDDLLGPPQVLVTVDVDDVEGGRHGLEGAQMLQVQPKMWEELFKFSHRRHHRHHSSVPIGIGNQIYMAE